MAKQTICTVEGCGNGGRFKRGMCNAHYARWRHHGDPMATKKIRIGNKESLQYFRNVVIGYEGNACLIWPFSRNNYGYAVMQRNGRRVVVSRMVCELAYGAPPTPKHEAAHSCGNGHLGCVNERHLRWATHAENHGDRLAHGTCQIGEESVFAKLTRDDVLKIRSLKGKMLQREIASMYGISQAAVSCIYRGISWSWLGDDGSFIADRKFHRRTD